MALPLQAPALTVATPSPMLVVVLVAIASTALTGLLRRYAIAKAVLDIPNERSLHREPTPRGGGMSLVVLLIGFVVWCGVRGWVQPTVVIALAGGAAVVAAVGWIDDLRSLSSGVRAAAQTVAAIWFMAWIGGMPALHLGSGRLELGAFGAVLGVLGIVWSINLYNFMDGIDGIAGGQAVVSAAFGSAVLAGIAPGLGLVYLALVGACLGFLVWNWAPARIFMGDAGSGFLGFLFAALAILSEREGGPPVISWVLFGGVFIFDATVTLVRRMLRRERWYAAHRRHAYQRAVQSGLSHAQVTSGVMLISALLGLLGIAAMRHSEWMLPAVVAALVAQCGVYLWVERRMPMWGGPSGS